MLAVVNVVENRLNDTTYEFRSLQTYEDVIFQQGRKGRYHFDPVTEPRFWLAYDVLTLAVPAEQLRPRDKLALTNAFAAAQGVYQGQLPDTTSGAMYFYTPKLVPQPDYIQRGLQEGRLEQVYPPGVNPADFSFFRRRPSK